MDDAKPDDCQQEACDKVDVVKVEEEGVKENFSQSFSPTPTMMGHYSQYAQATPFSSSPAVSGGYALPFPPFLANPFMAPYLPQYGHGSSEEQVPVAHETGMPADASYRYNPYSGGYFFTPSQYQEMIQQYFQGVLALVTPGVPAGASPASETGEVVYDDVKECADMLKMTKLTEGVRQPQAAWFPPCPVPPAWPPVTQFRISPQPPTTEQPSTLQPPPAKTEESCHVSTSSAGATNGSSSDVPPATTPSSVHSHPYSFPSPATTVSEQKIGSVPDSVESSPEKAAPDHLVVTASRAEVLASQSDSEVEAGKSLIVSERPSNADNPTSMLIKKQMSEIEKEILRRSANQHIRQVDPRELEALLEQERNILKQPSSSTDAHNVQVTGWTESGIPWSNYSRERDREEKKPRTLNEISSQTDPLGSVRPTHLFQPHFPQAPTAFPRLGVCPPQRFYPPAAPHPHHQTEQQITSPSSNAYDLPNRNQRIPVTLSPGEPDYHVSNGNVNINGSVERGKGGGEWQMQENGRTSTDQLEANEEPVWVMRESYLRRLKREEQRQQQRERREEELALARADKTAAESDTDNETDKLLERQRAALQQDGEHSNNQPQGRSSTTKEKKKEVMIHEPAVLIEGVLFRARYLGSTQLVCEGRPTKATRMMQAQEAVSRIKAPEDELQPSTEVDFFISTEKIMVLNTDLQRISDTDVRQDIMMDHPLRTISYIADIGDVVVLMARRVSQSSSSPDAPDQPSIRRTPKVICHVFESEEAQFIAQSIGQAFQVAYVEFLRANGIDDPRALQSFDYEEVLNSQEIIGEELEMFANKESQKDVVIPKQKGEILGVVVVESGWGSMLPTVVVANLMPGGPASRCNQLNIGDQIIAINGISLVGLPLSSAQNNIKNTKNQTAVKLTVVHTPPVVEVRIRRPDSKYQLGFSVQNGVICSLLRGGIAERGGVRVGHRIIEINNQSVVAVAHEKIVNMLATAVGEIQMKTMPTSMFRLLTGQETPIYI